MEGLLIFQHDATAPDQTDKPVDRDFQVFTLRIPNDLAQEIRAAAHRQYSTQSELIRRFVRAGLAGGAQ
jgi:hypothetical protein